MNNFLKSNQVTISGEIASEFYFSHESFKEKFYLFYIDIERKSGVIDRLPVMVSERLTDVSQNMKGTVVTVKGQYRSHNHHEGNKSKLMLYVFVLDMEFADEELEKYQNNSVCLEGTICKKVTYRETPKGREIADVLCAVNRENGKSDYIPCVCWGRAARFVSGLDVGSKISIKGRIQSRVYVKKVSEDSVVEKVAYEVSANSVSLVGGTDESKM